MLFTIPNDNITIMTSVSSQKFIKHQLHQKSTVRSSQYPKLKLQLTIYQFHKHTDDVGQADQAESLEYILSDDPSTVPVAAT